MRQLLLRVPEELYARLTARARERGQSVNALAVELLGELPAQDRTAAPNRLRAKARQLGVLAESRSPQRTLTPDERATAIDSARGLGRLVDDLFQHGR